MALRAITTVYSYRPPEARRVIDKIVKHGFPHHMLMGGVLPAGGLDNFHHPVIDQVLAFHRESLPRLKDFKWHYPTPGSEQGIQEVMTRIEAEAIQRRFQALQDVAQAKRVVSGRRVREVIARALNERGQLMFVVDKIYVLKGEYEGYGAVAEQRCIATEAVDPATDPRSLKPGYWFISNPSARDGNIIPNDFIAAICNAGHKVFYDLAYLDSTRPHVFDLSHPNIFAVVVSFSKTYGLFYDRIGFTFSREPIPSLYGTKWFKSIFALMIAQAVTSELRPGELYRKYRHIQESIIADINSENGLNMRPSDALLLGQITPEDAAQLSDPQLKTIAPFKRGDGYRFCLTPYYFERDPERDKLFAEWEAFLRRELGEGREILTTEQWQAVEQLHQEWLEA